MNSPSSNTLTKAQWVARIVAPVLIILVGFMIAGRFIKTKPEARKKPPAARSSLVRIQPVERGSESVVISAKGTVTPAQEIVLKAQVGGEIIEVHPAFVLGGSIPAGDDVLVIDPRDYELALEQAKGQLAGAQYEHELELGQQDIAKAEWKLMNVGDGASARDRDLALRKPHLARAKANLAAAQAGVDKAELNLSRAQVKAPFNALVRTRHVERGSQVSPQEPLATLLNTDEYWVMASVPVDRLPWIQLPDSDGENGSAVRVEYNGSGMVTGRVLRLLSDLEEQGRMARLLVSIPNPPTADQVAPLLIGAYVHVSVNGVSLDDVVRIPRSVVRDDETVWVATDDNTLDIRAAEILWRDADTVLVRDGLETGDRLIVSDLPAPVHGMQLQVESGESQE